MGQLELTFDNDNQCFVIKDKIIERRIQKIAKDICKKLDVSKANIKVNISIEILS